MNDRAIWDLFGDQATFELHLGVCPRLGREQSRVSDIARPRHEVLGLLANKRRI